MDLCIPAAIVYNPDRNLLKKKTKDDFASEPMI